MTDWHRIDGPNPPPRDGTRVLIFARWAWEGLGKGEDNHSWRVASWVEDQGEAAFVTNTSNPYADVAMDAVFWAKLPSVDEVQG